jgi:hypothetical protein
MLYWIWIGLRLQKHGKHSQRALFCNPSGPQGEIFPNIFSFCFRFFDYCAKLIISISDCNHLGTFNFTYFSDWNQERIKIYLHFIALLFFVWLDFIFFGFLEVYFSGLPNVNLMVAQKYISKSHPLFLLKYMFAWKYKSPILVHHTMK